MFVDASMRPHLHHRGMFDAFMDETDLVSHIDVLNIVYIPTPFLLSFIHCLAPQPTEEMFEKSFNFRKAKILRWAFE